MFKKLLISLLMIDRLEAAGSVGQSSFYDFEFKTLEGAIFRTSDLKGKVVLVVNTASKCGFTPQLGDLEKLYQKYKDQGFVILAFPSDDFKQEFEKAEDIKNFACTNYKVTFPMMEKTKVRGGNKHPFFAFLIQEKKGLIMNEIAWNFEKFLIDQNGQVVNRFSSIARPLGVIEEKVRLLLKKKN
ncbi:MAG: glutathione peroxidase [Bdellovibrionaceae bacterium]|nr:glutathione peroxidase [Pseudobdellovibrionaceae bacterium]MDW8189841.1 glutathione peroxidase [Pseudobdellovibrionaceae bacterium]